jgi:phage tail sheath gpL-like
VLPVSFANQYDIQVHPYNNSTAMGLMKTQLATLGGPMEQRPGIGVVGYTGTVSAATTLASAVNDGRQSIAHHRYSGATIAQSAAYELAAAYASAIASEPDPGMPLDTVQLTGITPAAIADRFSGTEVESLLWNGVAPMVVGPGNVVQVERAISAYTLNAAGVPDPSLLDITTIRALDYARAAWRQRMALRFPRGKQDALKQARILSETYDVLKQLEAAEILENVDEWKAGILVQQHSSDPTRIDVAIPTDVVPGLHVIAAVMNLILG